MTDINQYVPEIPKTIHYCWFGENSLGDNELACIESWKNYLPDYEIKQWNESNWDIDCCEYVKEAYSVKKWAFVSDYARFDILYRYGGLYFDTDVEVIRSLDDILAAGPFMGIETAGDNGSVTVNPGVGFAARAGQALLSEILAEYDEDHFVRSDGTFNLKTVVERTTDVIGRHGYLPREGCWKVAGMTLYPSDYFNPKDFRTGRINLTENTRAIHHFSMSWFTPRRKYKHAVYSKMMARGFPERVANYVSAVISVLKFKEID